MYNASLLFSQTSMLQPQFSLSVQIIIYPILPPPLDSQTPPPSQLSLSLSHTHTLFLSSPLSVCLSLSLSLSLSHTHTHTHTHTQSMTPTPISPPKKPATCSVVERTEKDWWLETEIGKRSRWLIIDKPRQWLDAVTESPCG